MPIPLWRESAVRFPPSLPVRPTPVCFDVRGRYFVYEPHDMRLVACGEGSRHGVVEEMRRQEARDPQFELPAVRPGMLVMLLTRACPLRCRYCFAGPSASPAPDVLPLETARQALRLIPAGRDFTVGFFGGEPLCAFDRLRGIVAEAKALAEERGVRVRFSLTTNAVLLDDATAKYLDRERFGLIVSLDGPAHLHDPARPDAQGNGSHAAALRGLEAIAKHSGLARKTTLRGTYDGLEKSAHLVERLQYLNETAWRLGLGNVSVEPADLSEGCASGSGATPVAPSATLREEYHDAAAWFVHEARKGRDPRFHHLTVRMQRLAARKPSPSECGAGVGYLTVGPEGTLYACHRAGPCAVGALPGGVRMASQAPWRDNRYYRREGCGTCWLRNVCGGGCRHNSLTQRGDMARPDPLGCWITETCVQAASWVLAELRAPTGGEVRP